MSAMVIGLLSETSLHPGAEATGGVVDLPVAREATTSYPVLFGSGLKGALRDRYEQLRDKETAKEIFGKPDGAGGISISDGRLLLLPVRSLVGHYRWVTCPYLIERLRRDLELVGRNFTPDVTSIDKGTALAAAGGTLYLEELSFTAVDAKELITQLVSAITGLIKHQSVQKRLVEQTVIISDDDFNYLASYGLPVNARNVLNDETKTSENLWYEETIPPDTLFYALLIPRQGKEEQLNELGSLITVNPYLQIGGNETVGQGWCVLSVMKEGC